MSYDDDWPDQLWENRRAMVLKTIRPATLDELKKLGAELFPIVTDPWCMRYNEFLDTHRDARYYRAQIPGHAEIVYCRDSNRGIWFQAGKSMGIIQSKGLGIMAEIVNTL